MKNETAELRQSCLELALKNSNAGRQAQAVVSDAAAFEAYITKGPTAPEPTITDTIQAATAAAIEGVVK